MVHFIQGHVHQQTMLIFSSKLYFIGELDFELKCERLMDFQRSNTKRTLKIKVCNQLSLK